MGNGDEGNHAALVRRTRCARTARRDKPALTDDGVLARVRESSVNSAQWYAAIGTPYLIRRMMGDLRTPKQEVLGAEFAGTVEVVGSGVTDLRPGDEIFGGRDADTTSQ